MEITLTVDGPPTGWTADDRLALLLDLDPFCTLRFDDGSTIEVTVHPSADGG